jgi:hypothetical protein
MTEAQDNLDAVLRIIEDCPNLHMGPTVPFSLSTTLSDSQRRIPLKTDGEF